MPGTVIPVKDAVFTFGANSFGLDDVTLTSETDLPDVSTNLSGGADELAACFKRCTVDAAGPWKVGGMALADGALVTFVCTVVATTTLLTITMRVASIKRLGKAKDVWRVQISMKSTGTFSIDLT